MNGRVVSSVAVLALAAAVATAAEEAPAPEEAAASEVTLGVDVASAYVFRGAALKSGAVAQPSMSVTLKDLPVTIGVWGNVDIARDCGCANPGQFSEIDLSAAYSVPVDPVTLTFGYVDYTYPGVGGEPVPYLDDSGAPAASSVLGRSDREISVSAEMDKPIVPVLTLNYGVGGEIAGDLYAEVGGSRELDAGAGVSVELGATLGYLASPDGPTGLSHYTARVGAGWKALSASLAYVGRIDEDVLSDEDYLVPFYGTVSVSRDF